MLNSATHAPQGVTRRDVSSPPSPPKHPVAVRVSPDVFASPSFQETLQKLSAQGPVDVEILSPLLPPAPPPKPAVDPVTDGFNAWLASLPRSLSCAPPPPGGTAPRPPCSSDTPGMQILSGGLYPIFAPLPMAATGLTLPPGFGLIGFVTLPGAMSPVAPAPPPPVASPWSTPTAPPSPAGPAAPPRVDDDKPDHEHHVSPWQRVGCGLMLALSVAGGVAGVASWLDRHNTPPPATTTVVCPPQTTMVPERPVVPEKPAQDQPMVPERPVVPEKPAQSQPPAPERPVVTQTSKTPERTVVPEAQPTTPEPTVVPEAQPKTPERTVVPEAQPTSERPAQPKPARPAVVKPRTRPIQRPAQKPAPAPAPEIRTAEASRPETTRPAAAVTTPAPAVVPEAPTTASATEVTPISDAVNKYINTQGLDPKFAMPGTAEQVQAGLRGGALITGAGAAVNTMTALKAGHTALELASNAKAMGAAAQAAAQAGNLSQAAQLGAQAKATGAQAAQLGEKAKSAAGVAKPLMYATGAIAVVDGGIDIYKGARTIDTVDELNRYARTEMQRRIDAGQGTDEAFTDYVNVHYRLKDMRDTAKVRERVGAVKVASGGAMIASPSTGPAAPIVGGVGSVGYLGATIYQTAYNHFHKTPGLVSIDKPAPSDAEEAAMRKAAKEEARLQRALQRTHVVRK